MARKKTTPKKKEIKESGLCIDCEHAYLMQSRPENPIVAECKQTKERNVAKCFICHNGFKRRQTDAEIHPMILL